MLLITVSADQILNVKYNLVEELQQFFGELKSFGIRAELVITGINMNKRYNHLFAFEGKLLRLWIRVWEHYAHKLSAKNLKHLFSENGIWNNDHIPVEKNIVLLRDYFWGDDSFSAAISQLFCDQEMGISSQFWVFIPGYDSTTLKKSDFFPCIKQEFKFLKLIEKYVSVEQNWISKLKAEADFMVC